MKLKKIITITLILIITIMCIPTEALAWIARDVEPVYINEGSESRPIIAIIMIIAISIIIMLAIINSYKNYINKKNNKIENDFSEQEKDGK